MGGPGRISMVCFRHMHPSDEPVGEYHKFPVKLFLLELVCTIARPHSSLTCAGFHEAICIIIDRHLVYHPESFQ